MKNFEILTTADTEQILRRFIGKPLQSIYWPANLGSVTLRDLPPETRLPLCFPDDEERIVKRDNDGDIDWWAPHVWSSSWQFETDDQDIILLIWGDDHPELGYAPFRTIDAKTLDKTPHKIRFIRLSDEYRLDEITAIELYAQYWQDSYNGNRLISDRAVRWVAANGRSLMLASFEACLCPCHIVAREDYQQDYLKHIDGFLRAKILKNHTETFAYPEPVEC